MTTTTTNDDPLRSLLHRWFVEYNPLYLFSAALVLAGVTLVSYDLASSEALVGLEMTAVAEVYALMLIGGAALLVRIGQRRAGVMVGLLAALYQCDLTMQTETSAYLGWIGWPVALAWAGLFHGKLRLLARALELRPSRSALFVPSAGALVLAVLPHALADAPTASRTSLVALVVFALAATALWMPRTIESAVGYDVRGLRAIRGTWAMWGAAALGHVVYTSVWLHVDLLVLAPIAVLLGTRFVLRERSVWIACGCALGLVLVIDPAQLSIVSAMVATVLVLRAVRSPSVVTTFATTSAMPPYRGAPETPFEEAPPATPITTIVYGLAAPIVKQRLLSGALATAHLAAWTGLTHGGLWRAHVWWLDLVLVLALGVMLRRRARPEPMIPIAALGAHFGIVAGWIRAPHHTAEWGIWSIGSGFVLLAAGLAVSWWLSRRDYQSTQTTPAIDVPSSAPCTAQ